MTYIPIDFRKAPFREKYITSETRLFNRWRLAARTDELAHIEDSEGDIIQHIPLRLAYTLLIQREAFCTYIETLLCKEHPHA